MKVLHAVTEDQPKEDAKDPQDELDKMSERSDLFIDEGENPVPEIPKDDDEISYAPSYVPSLDGEGEERKEDDGEEGSKQLALKVPRMPTEEERREHEISHIPYRSWCGDCVRGKGLTQGHHRQADKGSDKDQRRPLIAMDYFYLGKDEEQSLPILAMVEEQTGRTYALTMPEKGTGHQYNVAAVAKMLKVSGCLGGILKTDTERSLVALRTKLQEIFPSLGFEDASKGESQSNGLIESYVGKIQAQARTMRSALARHYPGLNARHPMDG